VRACVRVFFCVLFCFEFEGFAKLS